MESNDNSDVEQLIDTAGSVGTSSGAVVAVEAFRSHASPSTMAYLGNLFLSCVNLLVHCLIAVNTFVLLWFAATAETWSAFQLHVVLSVIGYQILMAQGILSMYPANSWSASLRYSDRRRAHWVLQLAGSGLAIAGSLIMILAKEIHFNSIHGKLALAALVFTAASLLNGLTSLYTAELRRFIPPSASKFSHVLIGTIAFALAMACLCFGFRKRSFREWGSETMAYVMITFTVIFTLIIILTPVKKMLYKVFRLARGLH